MKNTLIVTMAFFALGAGSVSVIAAVDAHRDAAEQVVTLIQMDRLIEQSYEQMVDAQILGNPELKPYRELLLEFFRKYMNWETLKEDILNLYVQTFTEAELQDLIVFYSSETGQKTIQVMPELLRRGAEIGVQRVQEHLPELEKMLEERAQAGK
ncbi:MAG: DUF2059 domain-containing protein [Candidatus Hydrogenedentes bacterium]|nr:DUF2059 domain-containing protein [Candidatus Hydrogenedentota bacterium]